MDEIYIVDRIEEEYIVLETQYETIIEIKKILVEAGVKEGDCLRKIGENYKIDKKETKERRERISNAMKGMWAD